MEELNITEGIKIFKIIKWGMAPNPLGTTGLNKSI